MKNVEFLIILLNQNVLIEFFLNFVNLDFALFMWLCNLQKIPEPKDPKIKKIASWLIRQSNDNAYHK